MKKAGIITLILGVVALAAGIVLGVLGGLSMSKGATVIEHGQRFTSTTTVQMAAGERKSLWMADDGITSSPGCRVQGPGANTPSTPRTTGSTTMSAHGTTWTFVGDVTATGSGAHRFQCATGRYSLSEPYGAGDLVRSIGMLGGGIGVGVLGLILTAIGLVLTLIGRRKATSPQSGVHPTPSQPYPSASQSYGSASQSGYPAPQSYGSASQPYPPAPQPYPSASQPYAPASQSYPPASQPGHPSSPGPH